MFHTSDQIDQVFHTLLQIVGPSRDVISISTPHPHPVLSKSSNKVLTAIFHPFASSLASHQFWSPNGWVTSSKLASFCESPIFFPVFHHTICQPDSTPHSLQIKSIPHPAPTLVPREAPLPKLRTRGVKMCSHVRNLLNSFLTPSVTSDL